MKEQIAKDATLASVWHQLTEPRPYVAGIYFAMKRCIGLHGNAFVRIGVTGTGQKPCYRIFHRDTSEGEHIFGSWRDDHRPLSGDLVESSNWSCCFMSYVQVEELHKEKTGWPRR